MSIIESVARHGIYLAVTSQAAKFARLAKFTKLHSNSGTFTLEIGNRKTTMNALKTLHSINALKDM